MSYFSSNADLAACSIDWEEPSGDMPRGCVEPTHAYGAMPGVEPFEVAESEGLIQRIPEVEWPERIELQERTRSSLQHRIDKDWRRPLSQGRCGYCWAYAVIGAMQACDARDGFSHVQYSAASIAAQEKRGADRGGWPPEAARRIEENGVCTLDEWPDCTCKGRDCLGPRRGCPARDLSRVQRTRESALRYKLRFFELPRLDMEATISLLLQDIPVAGGWTDTGAWCDGHAMVLTRPIRSQRRGYAIVPDNSWLDYKRRVPVLRPPRGGVFVVRTIREAA